MKPTPSPQNQEQDQELIKLLKGLESHKVEYPPDLLAARRADFIVKLKQDNRNGAKEVIPSEGQFIKRLEGLRSVRSEYPPELLAARRAAFIAQVEQHNQVEVQEELLSQDQEIIRLFQKIKNAEAEYPAELMAARRTSFLTQMKRVSTVSLLEALRSFIQGIFQYKIKLPSLPSMNMMRRSLAIAGLMLAVFVASLLGNRGPLLSSQGQVSEHSFATSSSNDREVARVFCKPGYVPPLCLAKASNHDESLTRQGNGSAQPAVAKDTLPGYNGIYRAAYANDGLYGPGSSWVSRSSYSWIKIDLGKAKTINTVAFGRDRLGHYKDHNPGQFIIAVALSDNVYADGNSSNDYVEYTQIFDSEQTSFNGILAGPETIRAQFGPVVARYIKITFVNSGAAIDEVEAFMVQPPVWAGIPTKKPNDNEPSVVLALAPTSTSVPANTATSVASNTPNPTDTPEPTNTPRPIDTSTEVPTDPPPLTDTPIPPAPTDTQPPVDTLIPANDTTEPNAVPTESAGSTGTFQP